MNRFVVTLALVASVSGAPSVGHLGYAGAIGTAHLGQTVSGPVATHQTHHSYPAGPAQVTSHTEYGVVGSQTVHAGFQQVQTGHQYVKSHDEVIPQPATSYQATAAQNHVSVKALPAPVLPAAPAPYAAIPAAPVPAGPAPADTVTVTKTLAPVRTHTRITPQQTNIVPVAQVNKYDVDVPVHVPVPVEREVIVNKHVANPVPYDVPRAVHVPEPYKVHPVQEVVHQPHVHTKTVATHSSTPVVTAHTQTHAVVDHQLAVQTHHVAEPAVVGHAVHSTHAIATPAVSAVRAVGAVGAVAAAPAIGYAAGIAANPLWNADGIAADPLWNAASVAV